MRIRPPSRTRWSGGRILTRTEAPASGWPSALEHPAGEGQGRPLLQEERDRLALAGRGDGDGLRLGDQSPRRRDLDLGPRRDVAQDEFAPGVGLGPDRVRIRSRTRPRSRCPRRRPPRPACPPRRPPCPGPAPPSGAGAGRRSCRSSPSLTSKSTQCWHVRRQEMRPGHVVEREAESDLARQDEGRETPLGIGDEPVDVREPKCVSESRSILTPGNRRPARLLDERSPRPGRPRTSLISTSAVSPARIVAAGSFIDEIVRALGGLDLPEDLALGERRELDPAVLAGRLADPVGRIRTAVARLGRPRPGRDRPAAEGLRVVGDDPGLEPADRAERDRPGVGVDRQALDDLPRGRHVEGEDVRRARSRRASPGRRRRSSRRAGRASCPAAAGP